MVVPDTAGHGRTRPDTAQIIATGDFSTRLDPAAEPDLARLTTSFNRMVDQLSQRVERDRRFAADVSHQLRSPLQTLSAAASILTRRRGRLDQRTAATAGLVAEEVTSTACQCATGRSSSDNCRSVTCAAAPARQITGTA
jgi:signal transduction histidine kinase